MPSPLPSSCVLSQAAEAGGGSLSCLCNALWNLEARPVGAAVGSPQTNEGPLSGGAGEKLCSEAYRPGPAWIQSCILHGVTGRHQKVSHSAQHTQKVNGGGLAVWCRNLGACRSFGGSQSSTCEVKWALEIITTNKAGGGDGIPAELFHSDLKRWCCWSAALDTPGNLENSAVATGLEKVSFHSHPKAGQCQWMFKLPHSFHMLAN